MGKKHRVVRIKIYSLEEIFHFLKHNPPPKEVIPKWKTPKQYYVDTEGNRMSVRRARVFFEKGVDCKCGLRGSFFALEKHKDDGFHLDLYAKNKFGHEILMTIDHYNPKANGGKNEMENYDPMCTNCNGDKADKVPENIAVRT